MNTQALASLDGLQSHTDHETGKPITWVWFNARCEVSRSVIKKRCVIMLRVFDDCVQGCEVAAPTSASQLPEYFAAWKRCETFIVDNGLKLT